MSRPHRVLHVIDKSFRGGGQTSVRHLLDGLRAAGVECTLSCRAGGPLVDDAEALGVRVVTVPFDKSFRPGPARAVAKLVQREGLTLVHAHGLVATTYCVLARRFFGMRVPLLYHQHGFHHHNYGSLTVGLRRAAERAVCSRVDKVIAVSRADARALIEGSYVAPERLATVPYGIPEPAGGEDVEKTRAELQVASSEPLVGLVGRLHPQKGVDVFLHAAARVAAHEPRARFVVVGTGELEANLHRMSDALGLSERVRWLGGRSAAALLPAMDVAVLSSRWEGLPLVLLEYMAAARPIVATDVEGCLEAVGETEAAIVPRDDPERLAAAILALLASPERAARLGDAARRRYEAAFTLEGMAGRVRALYDEVAQ